MDDDEPAAAAASLIAGQRWLALATIDATGEPQQSYLPFAVSGSALGIVVSRLASHRANLLAGRPAAIMFVDTSKPAGDAFACRRFSVAVTAHSHARGSAPAGEIWSALHARHGQTVALLQSLPDFEAIALAPVSGRLILGFASAHDLDAAALARALRQAVDTR